MIFQWSRRPPDAPVNETRDVWATGYSLIYRRPTSKFIKTKRRRNIIHSWSQFIMDMTPDAFSLAQKSKSQYQNRWKVKAKHQYRIEKIGTTYDAKAKLNTEINYTVLLWQILLLRITTVTTIFATTDYYCNDHFCYYVLLLW